MLFGTCQSCIKSEHLSESIFYLKVESHDIFGTNENIRSVIHSFYSNDLIYWAGTFAWNFKKSVTLDLLFHYNCSLFFILHINILQTWHSHMLALAHPHSCIAKRLKLYAATKLQPLYNESMSNSIFLAELIPSSHIRAWLPERAVTHITLWFWHVHLMSNWESRRLVQ